MLRWIVDPVSASAVPGGMPKTQTRLGSSLLGTGLFLAGCIGCMSEKDLSSYSEGSSAVVAPRASEDLPFADSGDEAVSIANVDAGGVETPPAEGQPPADISLDQPTGNPPIDPVSMVPEPTIGAAAACTGAGEFTIPGSRSCYLLTDTVSTWPVARQLCQAWGGDLVEIRSAEENATLTERSQDDAWLGATDQDSEGLFRWAGGGALDYTAWGAGQPDNYLGENCVELRAMDDAWNDVPCTSNKRAWCERPLPDASGESAGSP
jgi:Lectin C-type domain